MFHICTYVNGHKNKTWTNTFVYVHQGIAKHLTRYIRVKAHAIGASIRAITLACSLNFWRNFDEQDLSGRFSIYISFVYELCHRQYVVKLRLSLQTYNIFIKLKTIWEKKYFFYIFV